MWGGGGGGGGGGGVGGGVEARARRAGGAVAAFGTLREAPIVAVDGAHRRREELLVRDVSPRARPVHRVGVRLIFARLPARLDVTGERPHRLGRAERRMRAAVQSALLRSAALARFAALQMAVHLLQ